MSKINQYLHHYNFLISQKSRYNDNSYLPLYFYQAFVVYDLIRYRLFSYVSLVVWNNINDINLLWKGISGSKPEISLSMNALIISGGASRYSLS